MKRIAFIRPNMFPGRASDAMTPLVFALLAAKTPDGIETVLWDERLADIPFDEDVDLVAITVETYTARRAYQIAQIYRNRKIPVVMGGYHPTFAPEECNEYCDSVVVGDGENIWPKIVKDAQIGCLKPRYQAEQLTDVSNDLKMDRSIFQGKRYAPVDLVQFGRGCRYNCDFCSIRAYFGSYVGYRPVDKVIEEIANLSNRHFFFIDDNLFNDVEAVKALCRALIPLKKRWSCQATIDIAHDPALVNLMVQSGCRAVLIGFESLDNDNLKQIKKSWAVKKRSYEEQLKILNDAGLMIYGTFVFGYDQDSSAVFEKAVRFSIKNKFMLANFNPLTPMPGTQLFSRLKKEKLFLHERWWLDENFRYGDATFFPKSMSPEELTEGCLHARVSFNRFSSIFSRLLDYRSNARSFDRAAFFLTANLISRREIYSKQGQMLGDSKIALSKEG